MLNRILPLTVLFLLSGTLLAQEQFSAEDIAFFESKIRPILVTHCQDCHSGEDPESRFSVEFREAFLTGGEFGPAAKPGNPKESLLISAIKHDEFLKMPPKAKLSTTDVINFTRWVELGLPWPNESMEIVANIGQSADSVIAEFTEEQKQYWAFQLPVRPAFPRIANRPWIQSPIDFFTLAKLEEAGLTPAPQADKRTLIRRATFDLLGLPPTPQEIENFLEDDRPDAYPQLIDRLLSSPRYGERWGRHWLDVARYADSNGLDENLSYEFAYQYRDYVIRSMNLDKSYGQFVQEQIAGDLMPPSDDPLAGTDQLRATGFLAIGPKMLAEDDPVKMQMDIIDEQVNTLGQTFMGLTLGCARCHDHKFDPIPTADYYALAGIFKSTKSMENYNVVADWFERPLVSEQTQAEIDRINAEIQTTKAKQTALNSKVVEIVEKELLHKADQYLLASSHIGDLDSHLAKHGLTAQTKQDSPFIVADGYLLVEAEAAHRTNLTIVPNGYGEGIGILASGGAGGFAEYEIEVPLPGSYTMEVRYAAQDSRSVGIKLDGKAMADGVLGRVTGSWYPDTQTWVAEIELELTAGKHTLAIDSPKVYPHIDKFALILNREQQTQNESMPPSLSAFALEFDINKSFLSGWLWYLKTLDETKLQSHPFLAAWLRLSAIAGDNFPEASAPILAELQSDGGLGAQTPTVIKDIFRQAPPKSLEEVAVLYRRLIVDTNHAFKHLDDSAKAVYKDVYDEISKAEFPAVTPKTIPASAYPEDLQMQRVSLTQQIAELEEARPEFEMAMGVTEGVGADLEIHLRGSHITLGKKVPRRMLQIIEGPVPQHKITEQSGRLELAQWLASPENPLVNRVMANRVWRWHFGRGIVSSVDNFGTLGELPTHPALLDYLAVELGESNGSLKALHRQIMLSATYQMSTAYSEQGMATDPENKLLWRFNRRRLTGEEVRDSVLTLGPGLDNRMGGTLLRVKNRAYVTTSGSNLTNEFQNQRRSIYLPVVRSSVYEVLQALDFPDPAVSNGDRATTTVAPQALLMMNSSLVDEATAALSQRLLPLNSSKRLETAYNLIMGRSPNPEEISGAQAYIQQVSEASVSTGISAEEASLFAWQSLCRVLLSSNEFIYIE